MTQLINSFRALLLLACTTTPAWAVTLDVYVLTGQSNSLGTTELEGSLAQYSPGAHPADPTTQFFWANVNSTNTTYPAVLYGDSGGVITSLQMQQGFGVDPAFWGPEFGFGRTLADVGQSNVLIIKSSRGGGGNGAWDKAIFDVDNGAGHMWGTLRDTVGAALTAAQNSGFQVQVKGLMYLQGESNNTDQAAVADVRLSDLAANLSQYINTNYSNAASNMKTVVGEIAANSTNTNRILTTNLQRSLADSRSDIAFVQTHDLPLKSDGLHFGRDSKLAIGQRFADAFLDLQSRPEPVIARYAADLASPTAVPRPSTQGWTETLTATSGVTVGGVTSNSTRGWEINDSSVTSNPGYHQPLEQSDYQAMFDRSWNFRAEFKVVSGGGLAFWSATADNAPTGWGVAGGAGNVNGFEVDRVNGDQLQIKLLQNQDTPTINLGAGSANDFHTVELVGQAGSNAFDFLVDGQFRFASTIPSAAGLAGFEDRAMFGSGDLGQVIWNDVSLQVVLDPLALGDFSRDGNITTADHDIMRANWLSTGNGLNTNGEVTGDGIIDLRDFKLFKETLFSSAASALTSAVPEPSTAILLGFGLVGYAWQRDR